ncbi:MAG: N-formylglutamate deformylase [Gammaproteobacteria bacterium]|nr:N-formylglutamate deformylase [Gammaproteobacteria bacterium]
MSNSYTLRTGTLPLLVSFPHNGILIPQDIQAGMTPAGKSSKDTDWWVRDVYTCLDKMDASVLVARYSRYVIDLNRAPDDEALYPGQTETRLCPTITFDGAPLYEQDGPDSTEIQRRIDTYWWPYHAALRDELKRLRDLHGYVVLWDAHSIRGFVPLFFSGQLPDFNIGTHDGRSADPALADALMDYCGAQIRETAVLNGRFKGGFITRHYGDPVYGVHAVQLELNQQLYLDDENMVPPVLHPEKSRQLAAVLRDLLELTLRTAAEIARRPS